MGGNSTEEAIETIMISVSTRRFPFTVDAVSKGDHNDCTVEGVDLWEDDKFVALLESECRIILYTL